jgi:hypothetical protein
LKQLLKLLIAFGSFVDEKEAQRRLEQAQVAAG